MQLSRVSDSYPPPLSLCKLEPRRVLSVNAGFAAGVLDIAVQDDGGNVAASLISDAPGEFFVDANGDQQFDDGSLGTAELRGLIADLVQINVLGDSGVGSFLWSGNFQSADLTVTNGQPAVTVDQVQAIHLDAQFATSGNVDLLASGDILIAGEIEVTGRFDAEAPIISNGSNSVLNVSGNGAFQANMLSLGNQLNDEVNFGTLTLNGTSVATIEEDSATILAQATTLGGLELQSRGTLVVESSLTALQQLTLEASGPNGSILVQGDVDSQGFLQLLADGSIDSDANLFAANGLTLDAGNNILMQDGVLFRSDSGTLSVEAGSNILLSQLVSVDPAGRIEVIAGGDILDNLSGENANVDGDSVDVVFESAAGDIGSSADDLNLDVSRLQFVSTGFVHLSNAGSLALVGASSAGGGADIDVGGELQIAADLNIGASTRLEARGSSNSGDSVLVDTNASLLLDSGVGSTLSLAAGDDILLSGQIIAVRGPHSVQLAADLDHSSLGANDGDRGVVTGNNIFFDVQANHLEVLATEVQLTTDLETADIIATDGPLVIQDIGDLHVLSAMSRTDSIIIAAAGDLTVDSATAGTTIQLDAGGILTTREVAADAIIVQSNDTIRIGDDGGLVQDGDLVVVSGGDIEVVAEVRLTSSGSITLEADDDLRVLPAGSLIVSGQGDVSLVSRNQDLADESSINGIDGISIQGNIETDGTIRLESYGQGNIGVGAVLNAGAQGNLVLVSAGWIDELPSLVQSNVSQSRLVGLNLELESARHIHLQNLSVSNLTSASAGAAAGLDGVWQQSNSNANQRGDDFLDELGAERIRSVEQNGVLVSHDPNSDQSRVAAERESLGDITRRFRFEDTYGRQYALFLVNDQQLNVGQVMATNRNSAPVSDSGPNVYLESSGPANLNVENISTISLNAQEGGIVLVAGQDLNLAGSLITTATLDAGIVRTQVVNMIGDEVVERDTGEEDVAYVAARRFNGGEGVPREDLRQTTTEFVIRDQLFAVSAASEDFRTHVFQRVVLQFGFEGESGFTSFVGYFDGEVQQFQTLGDQGVLTKRVNELNPSDALSLGAPVADSSTVAAFSRAISYDTRFIDANQKLPTTAIVRRSPDFFLFENAAAQESAGVRDLTFESFEIRDVFTLGAQGATELPTDPPQVLPPPVLAGILTPLETVLGGSTQGGLELEIPQEKEVEVSIFKVYYEDTNENGQAEDPELPTPPSVLQSAVVTDLGSNQELQPNQRFKVESLDTSTGGSPSSEDLSRARQAFQSDPTQVTGAYAIIEKGVNEQEVVLDVFSVRDELDTEDSDDADTNEAPLFLPSENVVPKEVPPAQLLEPQDKSAASSDTSHTKAMLPSYSERLLAAGLMFVPYNHNRTSEVEASRQDSTIPIVSFDRLSRRSRRRH